MACAGFFSYESKPLTIQLKPEGVLNDVAVVIVTIEQPGVQIEKTGTALMIDAEQTQITFTLSQEETGQFSKGTAEVQVNLLYEDTTRNASCIGELSVWDNLHKEVMG